ncbi:MAG: peptidase C39 family protein [Anaerolineales bacterium]|nr:peptidase C39 family protein [Anaerolineales bacterium]
MPSLPISHHKQQRQADCLAACAFMVLAYWQHPISYARLINLLRIGYAGAPFSNLRYLESLGVSVTIGQGELATLRHYLNQGIPPIVFVATKELAYWKEATNHAVVVIGIGDEFVEVNDPAFDDAPITIPIAEFDLAWLEMNEFFAILSV